MEYKCYASLCLFAALLGLLQAPARAQTTASPSIVNQTPCAFTTFGAQSAFVKHYYTNKEYDEAKTSRRTECFRIQYLSDGLKVVGLLILYYLSPASMPSNLIQVSFTTQLLHPNSSLYSQVLFQNLLYSAAVFIAACAIFARREPRLR